MAEFESLAETRREGKTYGLYVVRNARGTYVYSGTRGESGRAFKSALPSEAFVELLAHLAGGDTAERVADTLGTRVRHA